jgi:hypothetical protein
MGKFQEITIRKSLGKCIDTPCTWSEKNGMEEKESHYEEKSNRAND